MRLQVTHAQRNTILAALATELDAARDTLDAICKASPFVTAETGRHYDARIADCQALIKQILEQTRECDV